MENFMLNYESDLIFKIYPDTYEENILGKFPNV
jgi:hypothetical protein